MIPKIIHYCWFGRNPKPDGVQKCIDSWRKYCPDYEIKEWNEDNFDVNVFDYTREAYEAKKWAFVSDVARLYALVQEGGIYLDTDVELVDSFDRFLNNNSFVGFEGSKYVATAVIGSVPNSKLITEFLNIYKGQSFRLPDGSYNITTNVSQLTELLISKGLQPNGQLQHLDITMVYPTDFFSPYDYIDGRMYTTANTVAIHWYSVSWLGNVSLRKKLSQLYHRIIRKHRDI